MKISCWSGGLWDRAIGGGAQWSCWMFVSLVCVRGKMADQTKSRFVDGVTLDGRAAC